MKIFKTNSFNSIINTVANVLVPVFAVLMAISGMFCMSNFLFDLGEELSGAVIGFTNAVVGLANIVAILLISVQYRLYLNETEISSMKENSFAMKFITFFGGGYKGYVISFCMLLLTSFVYPTRLSSVFELAFIWLEYTTVLSVLYYQARENVINQQTNYETLSV